MCEALILTPSTERWRRKTMYEKEDKGRERGKQTEKGE